MEFSPLRPSFWRMKRLYRFLLTGKYQPYVFEETVPPFPSSFGDIGLYLHIPFCKQICPFCPYNKVLLYGQDVDAYAKAVKKEVEMHRERLEASTITSLYIGGGTPLASPRQLLDLIAFLTCSFRIGPEIGVEVHPGDASVENLSTLRRSGVSLLSLGVQSFQDDLLQRISRPYDAEHAKEALTNAMDAGFDSVDVDLMFSLPGETEAQLKHDVEYAFKAGIGQLSAYPLIVFSFTKMPEILARSGSPKPSWRRERKMLQIIEELSKTYGYERTSIWTWTKKGKAQYTSVTRQNFVGFGAGAASRFSNVFYSNTCSVSEYVKAVDTGKLPIALCTSLDEKDQIAWWLFWAAYRMSINKQEFKRLFGREIDREFGMYLKPLKYLGILNEEGTQYRLTDNGGFLFHLIEQGYSLDFLDRMWGTLSSEAWPKRLVLG
jgi:coproporphyrinogen III oxidase-like Fe-S oxidoreductase